MALAGPAGPGLSVASQMASRLTPLTLLLLLLWLVKWPPVGSQEGAGLRITLQAPGNSESSSMGSAPGVTPTRVEYTAWKGKDSDPQRIILPGPPPPYPLWWPRPWHLRELTSLILKGE